MKRLRLILLGLVVLLLIGGATLAQAHGRGYLVNAEELAHLRLQWLLGIEPYKTLVDEFIRDSGTPQSWNSGQAGSTLSSVNGLCISNATNLRDRFVNQQGGAQEAYRKMLLYHVTQDVAYAQVARDKLMELTTTGYYGGDVWDGSNECVLHLSRAIPLWVQAADLLEGSSVWSDADRLKFSAWLSTTAYPKVAWASRVRRNNWGSAGSVAASVIGDYVGPTAVLREVMPAARMLTGAEAYAQHTQQQRDRMGIIWKGDSKCSLWGIRPHGGIPDELRRGSTGCAGTYLVSADASHEYTIAQIDELVFHAEFLRHRGDMSLYTSRAADGSGSLLQSLLFVVANPARSWPWTPYKTGILYVANRVYQHPALAAALYVGDIQRGGMVSFGQLTHPDTAAPPTGVTLTLTASSTPTASPTWTPTVTPSPTLTPTPTASPTPTVTPSPTLTPTPAPVALDWEEYDAITRILATAEARRPRPR